MHLFIGYEEPEKEKGQCFQFNTLLLVKKKKVMISYPLMVLFHLLLVNDVHYVK